MPSIHKANSKSTICFPFCPFHIYVDIGWYINTYLLLCNLSTTFYRTYNHKYIQNQIECSLVLVLAYYPASMPYVTWGSIYMQSQCVPPAQWISTVVTHAWSHTDSKSYMQFKRIYSECVYTECGQTLDPLIRWIHTIHQLYISRTNETLFIVWRHFHRFVDFTHNGWCTSHTSLFSFHLHLIRFNVIRIEAGNV